jgi:3-oxoacyl-[acyl-carrier-protein] synthase-1
MRRVWMLADNIVSPLGVTTGENFRNVLKGISGLQLFNHNDLSIEPYYCGLIDVTENKAASKFESLCQQVIKQLIAKIHLDPERTIFILSTTKGNISFLEQGRHNHPRIHLHETAAHLASMFGFKNQLVISNACISGVMALLIGKRLIENMQYDHALVVGADVLSRFVISGFQSLQALSSDRCRPFDLQRRGINLGECAAGVVLGGGGELVEGESAVCIAGGGLSNDANHISGPSRTGEELAFAIRRACAEANVGNKDIDFICAHGTATIYNDEMEAKALHLMNMQNVPLNSLKGYFGHTLGAAGVLESILSAESLRCNELIPTAGFDQLGVSEPVNVIKKNHHRELKVCLKTASGFGGCNAAIILKKGTNTGHEFF